MKTKNILLLIVVQFCMTSHNYSQNQANINNLDIKIYAGYWEALLEDSTKASWDIKLTILNKGIYSIGQIKNGKGKLLYQADGLWAFDKNGNRITMYEINSRNEQMIHIGRFIEERKILVERFDSKDLNKKLQESYIELIDDDNMVFTAKLYESNSTNEITWKFKRKK